MSQAEAGDAARGTVARDALEAAGVGVWDWHVVTGELFWDDRIAELHGVDPASFDGRLESFFDCVHPDDLAGLQAAIATALAEGGAFQAEFRVLRADGTTRWVQGRGGAVVDATGASVRMVGLGIDTTDLVEPRAQVARTLEHVSDGLLVLDRSWKITFANATAAQLLSRPTRELVGSDFWTLFAPTVGGEIWHRYHDAMEQQQDETFEAFLGPHEGWFQVRLLPAPESLTVYFRNIDLERATRLERDQHLHEQAHRLVLADRLQELTDALARAVTIRAVARAVLQHSQGALDALYAGIALLDPGNVTLTFVSLEELPDLVQEEWTRVSMATRAPLTDCVRSSIGMYHETPEALLTSYPELTETIRLTGNASFVNLPIPGTRGVIGALSMSWAAARVFGADDRRFLVTVAAQCGQAIERARLYERQQTVADALQQAVLPERLPTVAGVSLAARYEPTPLEVSVHVGGDWYDAFRLPDGRLGIAVGDVSGHGLAAAAIMGTLRNALRAYAFDGGDPATVLTSLNRLLVGTSEHAFATAVYGILDDGKLTWCNAGHPPFAVLDGMGRARLVTERTGPLLGLPDSVYRSRALTLSAGDAAVLYTDGLVEHRTWTLDDAFEHMIGLLERHAGTSAGGLCRALVAEGRGGRGQEDDACVLVVRLDP